jgi:hypothetical protein
MGQIDHLRDEKEGKAWAFGDELWTDWEALMSNDVEGGKKG